MDSVTAQLLAYAIAAAVSPIPIIGVILILATPRAHTNSLALLAGWLVGIVGVGLLVIALSSSSGYSPEEGGSDPLRVVLGVLLLGVAVRQWRKRSKDGDEEELPGWMRAVDSFDVKRSAALGFALAAINPKNLLLVVAGASAIAGEGEATGTQLGELLLFTLVATLGVLTPILISVAGGDRSAHALATMKRWLARNNSVILAVICALIGINLIVGGAG